MKNFNDFEIRIIESESGSKIKDIEISQLYNEDEIIYVEIEANGVPMYLSLMFEKGQGQITALTPVIKSTIEKFEEKSKEHYIDFDYHTIYRALELKRVFKKYQEKYNQVYLGLGPLQYSRNLRKYLLEYTKENQGATFSQVYEHCVNNFVEDMALIHKIKKEEE